MGSREQGSTERQPDLAERVAAIKPGTVVRYTPAGPFGRHCREGIAVADEQGRLVDTYWLSAGNAHIVSDVELASVEVLFDLDDYEQIDEWKHESPRWLTYHPNDRQVITSQHGLQRRWFIRKGAQPDHATQVANARDAVREAEQDVARAERDLQWRQDQLATLLGGEQS